MAIYAVGDVQGCWRELDALLKKINLQDSDELWLAGDLVNRGPDSLQVLRQVREMGERCRVVLGNHDLHFLAIVFGGKSPHGKDSFDELLAAPDAEELAHWLRCQKLIHSGHGHVMAHAGIPPQWSVEQAQAFAREVELVIGQSDAEAAQAAISYRDFFTAMYGNHPSLWDDNLDGMERLRGIVNYLTRMRLLDGDGAMDFAHKGALAAAPDHLQPWFADPRSHRQSHRILFGHWAALDGETQTPHCIALDTGCVWGRQLTAYRLNDGHKFQQSAL